MAIPESDISILIPTYRYRDMVVRAVASALDSGAGEIIVVDDRSCDGTIERLAAFRDPRLVVRENERNMGLWENHLHALGMARCPWIKFLQADDYLMSGGLAAYAGAVEQGVSVVWGAPTVRDEASGATTYYYALRRPRQLPPRAIQDACVFVGWLLGSPSHMMLRADAVVRSSCAWETGVSADIVVGAIAAAQGDTVLLPPGSIAQGSHPLQDARTQNARLGLQRWVRTLQLLRERPEPGLRRLANLWAVLNMRSTVRTSLGGIVRSEASIADVGGLAWQLLTGMTRADWTEIARERPLLREAAQARRGWQLPIDLDELLDGLAKIDDTRVAA